MASSSWNDTEPEIQETIIERNPRVSLLGSICICVGFSKRNQKTDNVKKPHEIIFFSKMYNDQIYIAPGLYIGNKLSGLYACL